MDTTPVEDIIEGNLDNLPEECENRCTEPKLRFIKYRQVARELVELVQAYSYKNAVELANKTGISCPRKYWTWCSTPMNAPTWITRQQRKP